MLHFIPDSLVTPKEENELHTIEDVLFHLRYDMDLVYCINMDGDIRLDYNDESRICMSYKDDESNVLNAGSQTDVQLGLIRLFSHLRSQVDTTKILELCNDMNRRLIVKAYKIWGGRIAVEYYLIPDDDPTPPACSSSATSTLFRRLIRSTT